MSLVREGRDLDFKRDAIGDERDAKRGFLKDVTSRANTAGESSYASSSTDAVDRDNLLFEPVIIEEPNFRPGWQSIFRPVLDSLWNAYGYPRCHELFNVDSTWRQSP